MTVVTGQDVTLDLRGLCNPEPILRLAAATLLWGPGDTVRVMADDECFANDFLRWCVGCDLDVLSLRYLPTGETELRLRTPGSHPRRAQAGNGTT